MRKAGRESEKRYANFLGGIPAGSLTRFGGGLPNSGWFGRPRKKPAAFRQQWTDDDNRILLAMAGYKTAEFIAKALHRSENAVRYRLAVLGKSSRVHLEGYARRTLAQQLHVGIRTIQRLIVQGLLDVRDPRIPRKSLEDACKTGRLTASLRDQPPDAKESSTIHAKKSCRNTVEQFHTSCSQRPLKAASLLSSQANLGGRGEAT